MRFGYPRLALVVLLAGLLTACGFHLRRPPELPAEMGAIYIMSGPGDDPTLLRDLRRTLETGSSRVVDDATHATALLHIIQVSRYSTLLAVSNTGVPLEYKATYQVQFSLLVGNSMLIEPQTLVLSRTYNYNISDALGNQEQEQGLYSTMASDMAQRITSRIQAAAKAALPPATAAPAPATRAPRG